MRRAIVIDFKTGRPENVAPARDNLQLAAYGLATALKLSAQSFTVVLVFLDGDRVTTDSADFAEADWWRLLERVKAAASKPPVATWGPHCAGCYPRMHCDSWRARAGNALMLLPDREADLQLTEEAAREMILRVQAVREAADYGEELVRTFVRNGGRVEADGKIYAPSMVNGRRSGPSVAELEKQGLGHLVKAGTPYEKWGWKRA